MNICILSLREVRTLSWHWMWTLRGTRSYCALVFLVSLTFISTVCLLFSIIISLFFSVNEKSSDAIKVSQNEYVRSRVFKMITSFLSIPRCLSFCLTFLGKKLFRKGKKYKYRRLSKEKKNKTRRKFFLEPQELPTQFLFSFRLLLVVYFHSIAAMEVTDARQIKYCYLCFTTFFLQRPLERTTLAFENFIVKNYLSPSSGSQSFLGFSFAFLSAVLKAKRIYILKNVHLRTLS